MASINSFDQKSKYNGLKKRKEQADRLPDSLEAIELPSTS
jgi:hypothetical protein